MRPQTLEGRISPAKGMSGSNLPRHLVQAALRELRAEGYAVSYAEAWSLVKQWRDTDALVSTIAAFMSWTRRGDIVLCRSKPRACDPRLDGRRQL